MTYKLTIYAAIRRSVDNAYIPMDENNSDYREYLAWVEQGNTPDVVDPTEIAAEEQKAQYVSDAAAANAYGKLTAMKSRTPAQIQTWVEDNVTNLAQAQDAIATLAIGVGILARRL